MNSAGAPDEVTYLEPDILIYRRVPEPSRVPASDVLLAIEVAVSSLTYDTGRKSQVYAALGVADYWVVNAVTLTARIHREPLAGRYRSVVELPRTETLMPLPVASLAVRLADLKLE
ncbi:MAG TPA: Uma2 family endonuclease [Hyphomicrobiaceae bacterium]